MIQIAVILNWVTLISVIIFIVDLIRLSFTRAVAWLSVANLSICVYDFLIKGQQTLTDFGLILGSIVICVLLFTQSKRMDAI